MKLLGLLGFIPSTTLWITIGASLLASAANVAVVALISRRLTSTGSLTPIFVVQFALVVVAVLALDFWVKWLLLRLTASTGFQLRAKLSRRILQTPLAQLEQIGAPRLLAALTSDVQTLVIALNQMPNTLMGAAVLLGCFLYLVWLSPPTLFMIGLLTLPAVAGQIGLRNRAFRRRVAAVQARDRLFDLYQTLTGGIKELKMHRARRAAFLDKEMLPMASRYETLSMQSRSLHALAHSWTQAIYFIFILALFLLAAAWQLSNETLLRFALVTLYARTSMNGVFTSLPYLSDAAVTADELEQIGVYLAQDAPYDAPHDDPYDERCDRTTRLSPSRPVRLQLRQLRHTYSVQGEEHPFQLGPINLELVSGEVVFLIGPNGSGKTTLAKLLLGLYTPQSGKILCNEEAVTSHSIDDYRQIFSVVFADFYLFDQMLGLEGMTLDEQARGYLQKFQLEHKVQLQTGSYSTLDLSTGQRQRLALLTAFLEDRPVYLFDEWAAGQDPQFKELFYRQLLPELRNRNKLVIVISHDDHYYDVADRLVKLDYGQIEYDRPVQPVMV